MRNGQAYQRKTEKFFVSKEKKFGKIDSWTDLLKHFKVSSVPSYIKKLKYVTKEKEGKNFWKFAVHVVQLKKSTLNKT